MYLIYVMHRIKVEIFGPALLNGWNLYGRKSHCVGLSESVFFFTHNEVVHPPDDEYYLRLL